MAKVFALIAVLFIQLTIFAEPLALSISAEEGVLINADTGAILFEKGMHVEAFPASVTKIATALYALKLKADRLDEIVTVKAEALASITPQAKKQSNYRCPPHWLETDGGHIGLKKGEEIALRHLLAALLISSANDAANVLAQHIGGTIPKFMEKMNSYLREIGCKNTHYLNPHGLHHPQHVSTAYDLSIMAREAMKYPFFRELVSTVRYICPQTNLELERTFIQTNLLLRSGSYHFDNAIGIKTGTTRAAGKTLVAAAKEGNRTLIAVVLGNKETKGRYDDVLQLFKTAFKEPKKRRHILPKGVQELKHPIPGGKTLLQTELSQGLFYDFYPAEEPKVKATIQWTIPSLPIEKGQIVGSVKVTDQYGNILQEQNLLAWESIEPTFWYQVKIILSEKARGRKIAFFSGLGMLIVYLALLRFKKKRRSSRALF